MASSRFLVAKRGKFQLKIIAPPSVNRHRDVQIAGGRNPFVQLTQNTQNTMINNCVTNKAWTAHA
jgi:hypothetical protein